ncbi:hypothetical protein J6590_098977 [Homalodisca vitripennis]|nr:hypothetical protein J6590_098977 [Homalodisca vitripennis]
MGQAVWDMHMRIEDYTKVGYPVLSKEDPRETKARDRAENHDATRRRDHRSTRPCPAPGTLRFPHIYIYVIKDN